MRLDKTPATWSRRAFLSWSIALGGMTTIGCAPSIPGGPPPSLKLIQTQLPFTPAQAALADAQSAAAKESGIGLAATVQSAEAVRSALARVAAARELPDLLLVSAPDVGVLSAMGLLVDARETLDHVAGLNGDLFPPLAALAAGGAFRSAGPSSGMPTTASPTPPLPATGIPVLSVGWGWLVRKDLLTQKSVDAPKSFDDWRAASAKLFDAAARVAGFGARLPLDDATDQATHLALLAYGAPLFDAEGFQIALDSAAGANGLGALASLSQPVGGVQISPPGVADWTVGALEGAFASGHLAQMVDAGGSYGRLVRAAPRLRDQIEVLPPPAGPKGWWTGAEVFVYAAANRASAERALAFVERVLQPARYDQLISAGEGSVVPPYAYLTKEPYWDADPNYRALFLNTRGDPSRALQYANPGGPGPLTGPVALVWQRHLLSDAIRSIVLQGAAPQVAAQVLRDQATRLVPVAIDQEPLPTETPEPGWLRWLGGL